MHFKTLFLFLVLTVQSLFAQVIPSARRTDWSLAGHRGAITVSANIIDITNFAGVGDGLTVNDVAIQNAIASLNGNSSIIYFPSGNYLFQSSIVLNDSIVLKGNSSDSTTLSFDLSGASDLIRVNGSVSNTIARFIANADKDSSFIVLDNPQLFQANDYIKIFTKEKKHLSLVSMKTIIDLLPAGEFIRVHRSFIIPLKKISRYSTKSLYIGDIKIPIGESFRKQLQEALIKNNIHS